MNEPSKKTIEKNANGEFIFTPYGEFLSYFHAHLEIFKRFCRSKNYQPPQTNLYIKNLKSYMASNVKNVDQYFHHIPKFAGILEVSPEELSSYLNKNFLETLPVVQEKFRLIEVQKNSDSPNQDFERITEEIIESTEFVFPEDHRFLIQGNLVVLENIKTGEIKEPQGLMSGAATNQPAVFGTDPAAEKVVVSKVIPDNPILEEIVQLFGEELLGTELNLSPGVEEEKSSESKLEDLDISQEDVLEDIEDLDFEEPEPEEEEDTSNVLDDIGDLLGFGEEDTDLQVPEIANDVLSFQLPDYFKIVQTVQNFQNNKDTDGYQAWMKTSDDLTKLAVSIRTNHVKEVRGESISWSSILSSFEEKVSYNKESILAIQEKVIQFNWVKIGLDRAIAELKKGDPEFLGLVKMAWPHLQKAFMESPDYDSVLGKLKSIIAKVKSDAHRKELVRVMTMTLNYLKAKFPPVT